MAKINLKLLKIEAKKEIKKTESLDYLNKIFDKYLGKKGIVSEVLRSLKSLPQTKRKKTGEAANDFKREIGELIEERKKIFQNAGYKIQDTHFDITAPGKKPVSGHLHPLTLARKEVEEIFENMGFSVVEGPEMESEWYNFDALNIPKDHPARDQWDTFYLENGLLLRTHTSPVQVRYMEKNNPPLRIITIGRVFRHEATDASHEVNFYQLDGLMVGKDVNVANFKAVIQEFFRRFFEKPVKIRLIPSFFPFVEPGFQVDMTCLNCEGKGCSVCSQTGWLEMMGAGMVHPNVFKNSGLNPKFWQGWAFGMGFDRLAMMKYKINDIRLFYSGDLRFLNQF